MLPGHPHRQPTHHFSSNRDEAFGKLQFGIEQALFMI